MLSYNTQLQSNNTGLQTILQSLQNKAAGSGEQATPEISISSNGLITATAGTKSSTYQLAFQAAKTITPSTISQIAVSSGYYTGGDITVVAVPTQAKSITPTTATQNVTPDSGKFLSRVTVTGDSNLVAGNIKNGVSIFGVSGTLEGGTVVDDVSKAIIEGTITEIEDSNVTIVTRYAFAQCMNLTTVNLSACQHIYGSAFTQCTSLTTAIFPACRTIHLNAFSSCAKLTTINFPTCTQISNSAFNRCSSLTTVSFPACKEIKGNAFASCINLTTINLPVCQSILANAFKGAYNLSIVQLGTSSICTLGGSNTFSSTPFAGYSTYFSGTPHIYVPESLITAYQSATNWAYFSSYFSSIESLEANE